METFDYERLSGVLHCSVRQLRGMHSRGELPPAVRIGKKYFWRSATIDSWLAGLEGTERPAAEQADAPEQLKIQGKPCAARVPNPNHGRGPGGRKSKAQQVAERRAGGAA